MNCDNCNLESCKNINYCPKTGKDISNYNVTTLNKDNEDTCKKCGFEQETTNTYCSNCGRLLHTTELNVQETNTTNKINQIINIDYLKGKFIIAISAIALLSIIGIIAKLFIVLMNTGSAKYINIFTIILGLNLAPIEVIAPNYINLSNINLDIGMIIYLIAPIICVSIPTKIYTKKKNKNNIDAIKDSLTIGVIYGLILGLISIFSRQMLNINSDIFYPISIIIKYNLIGVILNGLIIGTIVSYLNLYKYSIDNKNKIGIRAIFIIIVAYLVTLIMLIISLYTGNILGYSKDFMSIIGLTQWAMYILEIATFIPIYILGEIVSIINIYNISKYLNENIIIFIYGVTLLSTLILLINGYMIRDKYNDIKYIKIFSVTYAIFMGCIVHISRINTVGGINLINILSFEGEISIGGNIILSIIISYIYCYLISFTGYKLNKQ